MSREVVRPWVSTILAFLLVGGSSLAHAQAPLRLVNRRTTVGNIAFDFVDGQTFRTKRLSEQIALKEPTFWDTARRLLPLTKPRLYPFDPVTLQKDVVRLRRFYGRQGFPRATISYPASKLDTSTNEINILFTIDHGPPLIIQDVGFFTPDSNYAVTQFEGMQRKKWIAFRDQNTFKRGERFSETEFLRLRSQVVAWLKNRGYAFARVDGDSTVNVHSLTSDVRFWVDSGPVGRIDKINIEGNELVADKVIRRELPFVKGDRFRGKELARAEQDLFSLNLFRLAVVEVPDDQPRDSTVTINVHVQEADPRYLTAQTGYTRDNGVLLEGRWSNRNFFGAARTFTANVTFQPGIGNGGAAELYTEEVDRRLRVSTALRQPFLFRRNLSGILSPYFIMEQTVVNSQNGKAKHPMSYEAGLNTTLLYEVLPFRILSLEHTFSRASTPNRVPVTRTLPTDIQTRQDLYSKSVFTLNATLGRVNDYLNPERGFLVRPYVEFSGQFFGSALNYYKLGGEASYYQPVNSFLSLAFHISGGRLITIAGSRYNEAAAFNELGFISDPDLRVLENRFDNIRFYAGGANDVRGWGPRLLGPRIAQGDTLFVDPNPDNEVEEFEPVICGENDEDVDQVSKSCTPGDVQFHNYRYERIGGLSKLAVNMEARLPFPFFGPKWRTAVFLDFGQVSEGSLYLNDFRYGTGAGIRYKTPVGFARVDLAFKINPTDVDLIDAKDAFKRNIGRDPHVDQKFLNRFRLHFSIGQAF